MATSSRLKVIAGNWKMNKTIAEAVDFVKKIAPLVQDCTNLVYLAVPFTAIQPVSEAAKDTRLVIGAQNMNDASEGAFTGEIAGRMLKDAGAQFVILGHSERRHVFGESSEFINKKVKKALAEGLQPLLCVGETAQEKAAGKTEQVLEEQLALSLKDVKENEIEKMILAYEPVWAIGTNQAAAPEDAEAMHLFCRKWLSTHFSETLAQRVPILYGGSVKPDNAATFMNEADVDGLLVGGASLDHSVFNRIVHYEAEKNKLQK